jgi:hypothetical protein
VRATKAGEPGSDDRDPRMGLQLRDSERERRRRASGQRGARRQSAGADEDLASSAPTRLAGASQYLVDGNAGALALRVRCEHAARADHSRRTRRPGASSTHPRHGGRLDRARYGTLRPDDTPIRCASSTETICRPSGHSDTGISLKFASPSGIPMIVMHCAMPVIR